MAAEQINNGGNDIKELIKTLKELVLELRSVVDEISNPLLQPPRATQTTQQISLQQEESKKKIETSKTSEAAPPSPLPSPQLTTMQDLTPLRMRQSAPQISQSYTYQSMPQLGHQEEIRSREEKKQVSEKTMEEMNLEKLASLLRLVYELQSRVPPEYLHTLADILMKSSLIDETQKETLEKIIELGKISYKYELGVDESIAILAALAKELGLDVASITEELVRSILRRRGAETWESQQP